MTTTRIVFFSFIIFVINVVISKTIKMLYMKKTTCPVLYLSYLILVAVLESSSSAINMEFVFCCCPSELQYRPTMIICLIKGCKYLMRCLTWLMAYHDIYISLDFLEKIHRKLIIYLKAKHKNINSIQTSSSLGVYYQ